MAPKITMSSLLFLLALLVSCSAMSNAARHLEETHKEEHPAVPELPPLPKVELPPLPKLELPPKPELPPLPKVELPPFPEVDLPPKPEMPSIPEVHFPEEPEAKP